MPARGTSPCRHYNWLRGSLHLCRVLLHVTQATVLSNLIEPRARVFRTSCSLIFTVVLQVVRDLCTTNIVQTLTGTQRRWTLLEYCSSAAAGTESSFVPLYMTTPELAEARMRGEGLRMDRPFDVWQLGIMLYEIVQQRRYWRPNILEAELLHTLASADVPLPHEEAPLRLDNVQGMLRLMLARDPADRPKHDGLKTVLEDHDKSGTSPPYLTGV